MNKEQAVRPRFWPGGLLSLLPAVGQLALLVAVANALLLPATFLNNQMPMNWIGSDLTRSHWSTALLIQRTILQQHRLPLWNPYFGGGIPLGADSLAALFYPATYMVLLFSSLRDYYMVLFIGHLTFAGLGMLLLARRAAGLPRLPALVAAVSYMATPRLISHLGAGHVTILQTVAWFPWLALGCWATARDPRRWGALFGLCIGLTLLAGHPQMAYYGLLMIASLAAWLLIKRWRTAGLRALFVPAAGLAAAAVLGILIAAIHLLPLAEFTPLSTRQVSVRSMDAIPILQFLRWLIDPAPPSSAVPWEVTLTPGLLVLPLALFGIATRWRRVWPLVLGVGLTMGLAMGNASPLYLLVSHILPEFDLFRGLARIWFVGLLLFALLSGFGADSLINALRRVSFRGSVVTGALTLFLVALTLVVTDFGYARTNPVGLITRPTRLAREAAQLAGAGRVYAVQENISQSSAVQLQLRLADGWDPLLIDSYVSFMNRAGGYSATGYQTHIPYDAPSVQPNARLLGLMDVTIVVSQRPLNDPRLVKVGEANNTLIYKNTADDGPAYLVSPGPDGNPPSLDQLQLLTSSVQTLTLAPEQETYTFSTSTTAYFVIATPAFPGWSATLDGHSVPIQQIASVLPAIKVGPGTHTLSYTYAPSSVRSGAMLSALGLLAALAWLIIGRLWKPGKPRRSREDKTTDAKSAPDAAPADLDADLVHETT